MSHYQMTFEVIFIFQVLNEKIDNGWDIFILTSEASATRAEGEECS